MLGAAAVLAQRPALRAEEVAAGVHLHRLLLVEVEEAVEGHSHRSLHQAAAGEGAVLPLLRHLAAAVGVGCLLLRHTQQEGVGEAGCRRLEHHILAQMACRAAYHTPACHTRAPACLANPMLPCAADGPWARRQQTPPRPSLPAASPVRFRAVVAAVALSQTWCVAVLLAPRLLSFVPQ